MMVKNIKNFRLFLLVIVVLSFITIYTRMLSYKTENIRLTNNIENLGVKNSELNFTVSEYEAYIKGLNTTHKREMDSVLQLLKVKPKTVISYQKIEVKNVEKDTSRLELIAQVDSLPVKDSINQFNFYKRLECNFIGGRLYTKDSNPVLYIDSIGSENVVYVVKSYKKTFWDWLFKRKGKEVINTESKCGDVNYEGVNIIR